MENLIQSYIAGHRSEMVALWKEIVNTESGTRQLDGVNAVGAILTRELEQAGAVVHRVPVKNAGEMIVGDWNQEAGGRPWYSWAIWIQSFQPEKWNGILSGWMGTDLPMDLAWWI